MKGTAVKKSPPHHQSTFCPADLADPAWLRACAAVLRRPGTQHLLCADLLRILAMGAVTVKGSHDSNHTAVMGDSLTTVWFVYGGMK